MAKNNESKADRFRRLAVKRTKRVLDDVRILSNLANKGLYSHTPEQLKRIFGAIKDAIFEAEARFKGEEKKDIEFKL